MKRLLSFLCVLALMFTSVEIPMLVYAADGDELDYYDQLFATKAAPYMITCQPDSALILTDTVTLEESMLSPNYYGGVIDLSRLSVDYYYTLGNNTNFRLGQTVYPTLTWVDKSIGESVTLYIKAYETKSTIASFTIINPGLSGTDYFYPGKDITDADDRSIVIVPARKLEDTSKDIMNGFKGAADNVLFYDNTSAELYSAAMHKDSIVMPGYIITTNKWQSTFGSDFQSYNLDELSYPFSREDVGSRGITNVVNIKDYVTEMNLHTTRDALVFTGSKYSNCIYDGNTGDCTTITESTDTEDLYYVIALSSYPYFGKVTTNTVDTDAFTQVDSNAPEMIWKADTYYSMSSVVPYYESTSIEKDYGYVEPQDSKYTGYGPVKFDSFWKVSPSAGVSLRSGMYSFMHNNSETAKPINLFAESLIFSGCIPHLSTLTLKAADVKTTLNFYYKEPKKDTWKLLKSETYNADQITSVGLPELPNIDMYTPTSWCTDTNCLKPVDLSEISSKENSTVNLYAMYTYSGGTFKVTFYNDITGAESTTEYRMDETVQVPENPTPQGGYSFSNWHIVNSKTDKSGIVFNPKTFKPVRDQTYLIKSMWDVKGIITKVLTQKIQYYVGDEIDKSLLQVWVQDGTDPNNTRILEPKEYDLVPTIVENTGSFRFVITYLSTSATATCEVTGMPVYTTGIEATYKGGQSALVGTKLKKEDFTVLLISNNGKTTPTADFTIAGDIIRTEGSNIVTISSAEFVTTIEINGIRDASAVASLQSIKASYTGGKVKVNETIKAADIIVTAFYSDSTSRTLAPTEFNYSPKTFKVAGKQNVTITYSGLSTSIQVDIEDTDNSSGNSGQNTPTNPGTTSGSSSGNIGGSSSGSSSGNSSGISGSGNSSSGNSSGSSSGGTGHGSTTSGSGSSDKGFLESLLDYIINGSSGDDNKPNKEIDESTRAMLIALGIDPSNMTEDELLKALEDAGIAALLTEPATSIPSPGYLSGATILTNVIGNSSVTPKNTVDIYDAIDKAAEDADVRITLINGAIGNEVTPTMLENVKKKNINMYITMVSNIDQSVVLGTWTITGSSLSNTAITLDPNITFTVMDKTSDKLLYFSIANIAYPAGVTINVFPEVKYYESGELIRLYRCDATMNHAMLITTMTWDDNMNQVAVDINLSVSYCLSNSLNAYENNSSLLVENALPDEVSDEFNDGDENYDGEDDFDWGDDDDLESDEFNWDEELPSPKISLPKWLFPAIIGGIVGLIVICLIVILVLKAKKRSGGNAYSDTELDYDEDAEYQDEDSYEDE